MAERYQPGEIFARFLEDLPRIMMMQQQMELSERRLDIADKNAMADATYRADALAQAKETEKNNLYNDLLMRTQGKPDQMAIIHKEFGYDELAEKATTEATRIDAEKEQIRAIRSSDIDTSLRLIGDYLSTADPTTTMYTKIETFKETQIGKKYASSEEVEGDAEYGPAYKAAKDALGIALAGGQHDVAAKHDKEIERLTNLFLKREGRLGKLGTVGLPEVDDKDEDGVASELLKGTVFDVVSDTERYKDIPGYGILPEEELEKLNQRGLPTDRPAKVSDIKKISQSDMFSNVKGKTTKQRAQIIGKILGRDVSEEESEKLILEIGKATLIGRGKEFVSGVAAAIDETPKYPIRTGQYAVD
jgi:hypothetical protein|tara:strand:- start:3569 stop:4651 length:1083 start_codon:yes stop_codon:yes gene_type:complete